MNIVLSQTTIAELNTAANNFLKELLSDAEKYETEASKIHDDFEDLLQKGIFSM